MNGLYRALMAHRIHQDRLMWSRVQLLSALQAAAFAGSWAIKESSWFAAAVMLIAAILTWMVYALIWKDGNDSKVNQSLMDELAKKIVDDSKITLPAGVNSDLPVRFTSSQRIPFFKSGSNTIFVVFITFTFLNVVMFLVYGFFSELLLKGI